MKPGCKVDGGDPELLKMWVQFSGAKPESCTLGGDGKYTVKTLVGDVWVISRDGGDVVAVRILN